MITHRTAARLIQPRFRQPVASYTLTQQHGNIAMQRWSFGYYTKEGHYYRRTVEAPSLDAAVAKMKDERPDVEIVSVNQTG